MGDCEKKDWKGTAHALDPISRPEIVKAVAAVKKSRVDDAIRFNVVDVEEPPKLALLSGETTRRVVSVTFQVESKVSLLLLAVVLASDLALLLATSQGKYFVGHRLTAPVGGARPREDQERLWEILEGMCRDL